MDGRNLPTIRLIIFAVTALAHAATPAFAQPGGIMIPIDRMTVGAAPADFEFARTGQGAVGQWVVVEDNSAPGKRASSNRIPIAQTTAFRSRSISR